MELPEQRDVIGVAMVAGRTRRRRSRRRPDPSPACARTGPGSIRPCRRPAMRLRSDTPPWPRPIGNPRGRGPAAASVGPPWSRRQAERAARTSPGCESASRSRMSSGRADREDLPALGCIADAPGARTRGGPGSSSSRKRRRQYVSTLNPDRGGAGRWRGSNRRTRACRRGRSRSRRDPEAAQLQAGPRRGVHHHQSVPEPDPGVLPRGVRPQHEDPVGPDLVAGHGRGWGRSTPAQRQLRDRPGRELERERPLLDSRWRSCDAARRVQLDRDRADEAGAGLTARRAGRRLALSTRPRSRAPRRGGILRGEPQPMTAEQLVPPGGVCQPASGVSARRFASRAGRPRPTIRGPAAESTSSQRRSPAGGSDGRGSRPGGGRSRRAVAHGSRTSTGRVASGGGSGIARARRSGVPSTTATADARQGRVPRTLIS